MPNAIPAPASDADRALAAKFPTKWTACGSIGFPSATAAKLYRLGLLERRLASPGLARLWDYRRVSS